MKVGISMLHCLSEPFNKMLKYITNTEVTHVEIVDDGLHALNKRKTLKLKEVGKRYNLQFSVHAPFADINIASPSKFLLNAMIKRLEKSIHFASLLEAHVWVFHPGLKTGISMFYPELDWIQNCETARILYKIAQKNGVEIAIENVPEPYPFLMKSVEHFKKFYEEVDVGIGLALDVGHANLNGQIELFLKTFSNKVVHIHVHDNRGKEDEHLGIGYGTVNWRRFVEILKETSYNNVLVIESIEKITESINNLKSILE
ncbi:MAG: sugar phosphate isomerase/epimerase family protein [Candidatus Bathyarchaeia archaeon]|nr:sugar phosphate isomerase/epimerase [Candidatus Bathyarchaeota archaeon]